MKSTLRYLKSFLFLFIVGGICSCGPKLNPETLYGVWKGDSKAYGPTLITFIGGGKCELQHYRHKDSSVKKGSWRLAGREVEVEIEPYGTLKLQLDTVEMDDGPNRERLTDIAKGVAVVKM